MNPGKRFEQKFRESMEPHAFVLRIRDNVTFKNGHTFGEESEADFLVANSESSYLVECKATSKKSLEFYNVKEHQEESLLDFDGLGDLTHGFLAVEFYSKEGYRKPHTMFLLPITEWMRFKGSSDRKSVPISYFREHGIEVPYKKGAYAFDGKWFK